MAQVVVMVSGKPTVADLVQEQAKTALVRLRDGTVIKRHRIKHAVSAVRMD